MVRRRRIADLYPAMAGLLSVISYYCETGFFSRLSSPVSQSTAKGDGAMKDLINTIAEALVDHPAEVNVTEVEGNQISVLELKVAREDLGKVIGKQGKTARAMRTILSAASAKIKKRTVLEIIE